MNTADREHAMREGAQLIYSVMGTCHLNGDSVRLLPVLFEIIAGLQEIRADLKAREVA